MWVFQPSRCSMIGVPFEPNLARPKFGAPTRMLAKPPLSHVFAAPSCSAENSDSNVFSTLVILSSIHLMDLSCQAGCENKPSPAVAQAICRANSVIEPNQRGVRTEYFCKVRILAGCARRLHVPVHGEPKHGLWQRLMQQRPRYVQWVWLLLPRRDLYLQPHPQLEL